jgi:hypothetical protein
LRRSIAKMVLVIEFSQFLASSSAGLMDENASNFQPAVSPRLAWIFSAAGDECMDGLVVRFTNSVVDSLDFW